MKHIFYICKITTWHSSDHKDSHELRLPGQKLALVLVFFVLFIRLDNGLQIGMWVAISSLSKTSDSLAQNGYCPSGRILLTNKHVLKKHQIGSNRIKIHLQTGDTVCLNCRQIVNLYELYCDIEIELSVIYAAFWISIQKTHQNQDPVGDLCELNDQSFEVPLEKLAAQYLAGGPMAWCPF